jgi:uncharacterized membrane protein
MSLDPITLLAIAGMAIATYVTRVSGLYLLRGVNITGRVQTALDAVPPAILMAVIAPTILATGIAETIAAALTAGAATLRLPLVVVILTGVVSVVLLRMIIN